jgi:hypothetical protein
LPDIIGSSQSPCMRRAWQIIDLKPRTDVNDEFVRLPNTVVALAIGPTLEDRRAATVDRAHSDNQLPLLELALAAAATDPIGSREE